MGFLVLVEEVSWMNVRPALKVRSQTVAIGVTRILVNKARGATIQLEIQHLCNMEHICWGSE